MAPTLIRRKFLWVTVVAVSLLVLAPPLISYYQSVGANTIFPKTSSLTSSFGLTVFRTAINSVFSHLKAVGGNTIIGTFGFNTEKHFPKTKSGSGSASAASSGSASTFSSTTSSSSGYGSSIEISSFAYSADLKVYSNSPCNSSIVNLNWGSISPGGTATKTVYVEKTGASDSLALSIQASNWNPTSAGRYLTLSWNKQGTVLAPGQSTDATITLTVSSGITGIKSFSVQISISGTG
jgi:hypothetical protein